MYSSTCSSPPMRTVLFIVYVIWDLKLYLNQVKGTESPDFWPLFFFLKQLLLAPVGKPSDNFDFFRIFAEIFDYFGASPVSTTPAMQTILL
jgi:hypothetical protein